MSIIRFYSSFATICPLKKLTNKKHLAIDADTLADQHKKQKKELVAKVQSLKKSVNKGDKKKKKLVDAEIEKLEKDFADKCALEIANLSQSVPKVVESEAELSQQVEDHKPKMSKAQKKREKKEADEKQREKDIALQEIENLKGPAHIELTRIKEKLSKMDLDMKEVCADGNCMFYAVSDQLGQHLQVQKSFKELRELTSNYMLQNPDSFQPFLCSEETGDPLTETEYKFYCEKIAECVAPVWGSMTELKALSEILSVPIQVVQAEGSETLIESANDNKKLIITYHRHMFGSGEHYNSTCTKKKDNDF